MKPITAIELDDLQEYAINGGFSKHTEDRGFVCLIESYKQAVGILREESKHFRGCSCKSCKFLSAYDDSPNAETKGGGER